MFISFCKIMCFINEFMSFCKLIDFTKQMYENMSLSPNHVFTIKISRFTTFIFLLIILWFFIKIIRFLNKIGPIRAHMGPYRPIWAHMGPARALKEREKLKKSAPFFNVTHFSPKSRFLTSRQRFFIKKQCSSGFWPRYASERH